MNSSDEVSSSTFTTESNARWEDDDDDFYLQSDAINNLFEPFHVPFTQTSISHMDFSIITTRLRQLRNSTVPADQTTELRKKWLKKIKNYVLLQRMKSILQFFYESNIGNQYLNLRKRKFFRIWAQKSKFHSNRYKWVMLGSIIRHANYQRATWDTSERIDEQRVELASRYLMGRKEYQPRFNFFILRAIPLLTERQQKTLAEELESDRQRDIRHFNGIFTDDDYYSRASSRIDSSSILAENLASEATFGENIENRDVNITSPRKRKKGKKVKKGASSSEVSQDSSDISNDESPKRRRSHSPKKDGSPVKNELNSKNTAVKSSSSKLWIIAAIVLLVATAVAAFAVGFGTPLAYLIHKGEYQGVGDYIGELKVVDDVNNQIPDSTPVYQPEETPLLESEILNDETASPETENAADSTQEGEPYETQSENVTEPEVETTPEAETEKVEADKKE
ncbi:hypothetical protein TRFO_36555 [Tritrichomonas foetus]|uniref:Uncharacterized protein n=1 Tax=Tritrichomonas foetus TaxID=1144522 RepID=A0A1J4JI90_9EUKA|nr:hypothetical protein TRFO_36555 [Tritrichomonas foetus]|eukprot:OHS97237.1 hypothetical protein TRFO_36555 [Tritrichomonas foetus]